MDFTMRRLLLVTSMFILSQDLPPTNSLKGYTKIMEFKFPWERNYYKSQIPASSKNIAKDICLRDGFQLAKVEIGNWFRGLKKIVNFKYWLDVEMDLRPNFYYKNGTDFPGRVVHVPLILKPYCVFVRKKNQALFPYADECSKKKYVIFVPSCSGSDKCPPRRSDSRMTWFEAKNITQYMYEGIPVELTGVLDEQEEDGYWVDIARSRWIYQYQTHKEEARNYFWKDGEPSSLGNNERCVIAKKDGLWTDSKCTGQTSVGVLCFNESRVTTLFPPMTKPSSTTTSTSSSTTSTTSTTTTGATTTKPTTTSTTSSTKSPTTSKSTSSPSTTYTTTYTTTERIGSFQNTIDRRKPSEEVSDIQVGFIAGTVGLLSFIIILAAVLALMISRYRDRKSDEVPPRRNHPSFTAASKSLYGNNPYSDLSNITSNFKVYTANRFNTRGGLSSKLYKSDETYFKNSILRNSTPIVPPKRNIGYPTRHSIALPPPRRW